MQERMDSFVTAGIGFVCYNQNKVFTSYFGVLSVPKAALQILQLSHSRLIVCG